MICFWNASRNIWPTKTAINNLSWNQNGLLDTVNVSQKQPCLKMGFGCDSQAGNQRADGWTSRAKSCEEKRGQIKFIIILWVWGQITADTSRCSPGIFVLAVMHFLFVCSWTLLFWEDPTPKRFHCHCPSYDGSHTVTTTGLGDCWLIQNQATVILRC